jgi:hypothetical protein
MLTELVQQALDRLESAERRIQRAREEPATPDNLREWLDAVSDFARALSEIHELDRESLHRRLDEVSGSLGLERPAGIRPRRGPATRR